MQKKTKVQGVKKLGIKASTVKDPISTPVIKNPNTPIQEIEQKWVPFFRDSDNLYPNDLAKRARRSSTHGSIINQKLSFTVGKGFIYTDSKGVNIDYIDHWKVKRFENAPVLLSTLVSSIFKEVVKVNVKIP
jgi:hypothetical protein